MRMICCECGILYGLKEPYKDDRETHGFCDECYAIALHNLKERQIKRNRTRWSGVFDWRVELLPVVKGKE